jgi:hypothetical protein
MTNGAFDTRDGLPEGLAAARVEVISFNNSYH